MLSEIDKKQRLSNNGIHTSSSVANGEMVTIGPKTSSVLILALSGSPVITVGSIKYPYREDILMFGIILSIINFNRERQFQHMAQ